MTQTINDMLVAHPAEMDTDRQLVADCVAACGECGEVCTACADACLSERMVAELTTCIRANLDCADICATTGRVLSRHSGADTSLTRAILQACAQACRSCADECAQHADMHEHCRICAAACRRCEDACNQVLAALS